MTLVGPTDLVLPQPLLSVIRLLLVEGEVDQFAITILSLEEWQLVLGEITEVFHGVLRGRSTQTLKDMNIECESAICVT